MQVLLIDDHELIWNGTRRLLEQIHHELSLPGNLHFVAIRDLSQLSTLSQAHVDLILLDYHLPGVQGIEGLRLVQRTFDNAIVCMLSAENDADQIRAALEAGAAGFVPKSYGETDMVAALGLVLRNKVYVPAEFLFAEDVTRARDTDEVRNEDLGAFLNSELSARQRQVLALALQGLPNKTIARRLQIAEGTVKVHLSMVYRALGVRNRVAALCRVLHAGADGAFNPSPIA